jgi:hypothetical protein
MLKTQPDRSPPTTVRALLTVTTSTVTVKLTLGWLVK